MNIEIVAASWKANLRCCLHALHRLLVQEAALRGAHVVQPRYARINILIATTLRVVWP